MVYSAPMAGVSDYPFRQILRLFGSQPLFSEMISAETLVHSHPKTLKMLTFQKEQNVIAQLVGARPNSMVSAAQMLSDQGVQGININMGCPVKKLIQNHSGAMLLQDQDLACRLVESVKMHTHLPVSVKTRLGWERKEEILTFAPKLVAAGADQIEVHARTKEQGYAGKADWKALQKLNLKIPLVINGDIINRQDALSAMTTSKAKAVMIGRALLGHPWRLSQIATGICSKICIEDLVLYHLDLLLSYYGHAGLYVARKHLAWYANCKKGVAKWREKMYLEEDEKKLKKLVQDFWKGVSL